MAENFPDIQEPSTRKVTYQKKQLRTEFENGSVQTRRVHTRGRFLFEFEWQFMPVADFIKLKKHFDDSIGSIFSSSVDFLFGKELSSYYLSDPNIDTLETRYSEDTLTHEHSGIKNTYKVKIKLEEK